MTRAFVGPPPIRRKGARWHSVTADSAQVPAKASVLFQPVGGSMQMSPHPDHLHFKPSGQLAGQRHVISACRLFLPWAGRDTPIIFLPPNRRFSQVTPPERSTWDSSGTSTWMGCYYAGGGGRPRYYIHYIRPLAAGASGVVLRSALLLKRASDVAGFHCLLGLCHRAAFHRGAALKQRTRSALSGFQTRGDCFICCLRADAISAQEPAGVAGRFSILGWPRLT